MYHLLSEWKPLHCRKLLGNCAGLALERRHRGILPPWRSCAQFKYWSHGSRTLGQYEPCLAKTFII